MAKKTKSTKPIDPTLRELDAIKRLLILGLVRDGCTSADIAKALQIDPADLSRMMPTRDLKSTKG